ncbi:uncharacterized protein LOC116299637 [Actinia tenebrosa]|uniref:Uncharacterized protein LOC116299637 n=1 Tax=Actinia tenebrosa TaxID=6105 RepID=A0A6P8IEE1_ACTTE|nr:uncharacterized protein LOC116299637 [Actinia tenebrosa]
MEQSLLTLVLNSGVASERREACEFLDLKTRVEQEKFRQLSADLERRRIRKYNSHLEEQRKVEKELVGLQKDRLRFEREKQLRKRKNFSSRGRKQCAKSSLKDEKITLPMNEDALGGSASIAFDPKVEKYSRRRRRRKAKTETFITNSRKAEKDTTDDVINFPYLSEGEVKKFHKSCKSATRSTECRRWGAAWLYAKKEQETAMNRSERWTSLLLNAEKEKMRVLCEKMITSKERKPASRIALECWNKPGQEPNLKKTLFASKLNYLRNPETSKKPREVEYTKNVTEDKEDVVLSESLEENDENKKEKCLKSAAKAQSGSFSATKQQGENGGQGYPYRKVKGERDLSFVSPFSKGITLTKQLARFSAKSSKKENTNETNHDTLLQDVTSEDIKRKNNTGTVCFLPEL